jgi:regulatory protein
LPIDREIIDHRSSMPSNSAYAAGLMMLARRELSEKQLRQRLARREYSPEDIDAAIGRLKENRSLDDARVAGAIARMETGTRKRGRLRVKRQIEAAGISPSLAQRAVDEAFEEIDPDAQLNAALQKRLRGREQIADDKEFSRLYRYLLGQGFESDKVLSALRRLRTARSR